jgi:hypothetical protein
MIFAQVPSYVPANGLIGWWPFNGNANDESGNGNNGTNNGATLTIDRNGVANQAYTFDLNQKIGTFITNFPVYSVSIWAKINTWNLGIGTGNGGTLASHKSDGLYGNGWAIEHNQNQYCWLEYNANNNIQQYNGTPQLNTWFHVVLTSDSQGSRKLYIDGILTDTYNGAAIISGGNNYEFKIGAHIDGPTIWWFKGDLDDVGYWNRALTACEIQNLYTSQINSTFVTAGADQTICNGEQVTLSASNSQNYSWNNGVIDSISFSPTTTQDYIVTADSANCQSSDTVTVFVIESTSSTQFETSCDSYTWNGQTYTESGVYTGTTANCVTESLNLTIIPSSTNLTSQNACDTYTWNGQTYTASGVYTGTTANCVTQALNLTINTNTSSSISLSALDSYTWPVNNQTYTTTGAYTAVIPNAAGCDSTITLNLTMSFTGITDLSASKLSIYPNPTNGDFTITGLELVGTVSSLNLTDMNGKVVKVLDTKATKFSMASIKPGVYFLNIISGNKQEVLKIVKE